MCAGGFLSCPDTSYSFAIWVYIDESNLVVNEAFQVNWLKAAEKERSLEKYANIGCTLYALSLVLKRLVAHAISQIRNISVITFYI